MILRVAWSMDCLHRGTLHFKSLAIGYLLLSRLRVVLVDVVFQVWPHLDQIWSTTRMISVPVSDQLYKYQHTGASSTALMTT